MRTVALYLLLVAPPLLGLIGILRLGERLEAPPAIGGAWTVDAAFTRAGERGCVPPTLAEATALDVTQSGRYVRLRANDSAGTTFEGRLVGGTVVARAARAASAPGLPYCAAAHPPELRLRLLDGGGAQHLAGSWGVPECAACRALPFRAARPLPS